MVTTLLNSKLMHNSFFEVFESAYGDQPSFGKMLAKRDITTTQLYEELIQLEPLGPAGRVDEAGGVPFDTPVSPFSKKFYWNIFAIGMESSFEVESTDQSGKLRNFAKLSAPSLWYAMETDLADLFNQATNTAEAYLGPNGKPLCASDHPCFGGSTFSNLLASAAALGPLMLEDLLALADAAVTYRNMPWTYRGGYEMHIAEGQRALAYRILKSDGLAGTSDVDKNYSGTRITNFHCNPFFTQSAYVMLTAASVNPLFILKKGAKQYLEDQDIRRPSKLHVVLDRWGKGWTRNQGIVLSAGTA